MAAPALGAAGCALRVGQPQGDYTPPPPTPDEVARERAARDCDRLALAAREAARLRPDVTAILTAIADAHTTQAAALRPVNTATATPTAQRPSASRASATSTPPTMTRDSAVLVLAGIERAAVTSLEADIGRAGNTQVHGAVARLLASIGAAHSVTAEVLDGLAS